MLVVWLGQVTLMTLGCLLGLGLGALATQAVSGLVAQRTGLLLSPAIGLEELLPALGLALIGSLFALVPAALAYRQQVVAGLRG